MLSKGNLRVVSGKEQKQKYHNNLVYTREGFEIVVIPIDQR